MTEKDSRPRSSLRSPLTPSALHQSIEFELIGLEVAA